MGIATGGGAMRSAYAIVSAPIRGSPRHTVLKRRCETEHPQDSGAYTRAKDGFVVEVLRGTA